MLSNEICYPLKIPGPASPYTILKDDESLLSKPGASKVEAPL